MQSSVTKNIKTASGPGNQNVVRVFQSLEKGYSYKNFSHGHEGDFHAQGQGGGQPEIKRAHRPPLR